MALKDRIARMEACVKPSFPLEAEKWWHKLLADAKDNQDKVDAAYLLAINDLIAKPLSTTWAQVEERYKGDPTTWPGLRSWFVAASTELENEVFSEAEALDLLCYLTITYWTTFHDAPLASRPLDEGDRYAAIFRDFQHKFLSPLFWRLHDSYRAKGYVPPAWSFAAFVGWIKAGEVVQYEDLFQSLLHWMGCHK